jgi:tRNA(Ile)-lysidine synthetase-like protein
MEIDVPSGKYIVAVSGGVDSMVLLDILAKKFNLQQNITPVSTQLIIAHFNHGIRDDSGEDERVVRQAAKNYGLVFEAGHGKLGKKTSEEVARKHRYKFLDTLKKKYLADAIITAHHQDDVIETAFLNMLRGSGHRGLVAIKVNPNIMRPLVHVTKEEILTYAKKHKIKWREDATNQDETYLRNYIRKNTMPALTAKKRVSMVNNIEKIAEIIAEKDHLIATLSQSITQNNKIVRGKYIMLPQEVRRELVLYWLRYNGLRNFEKYKIEKIDMVFKTGKANTEYPIKRGLWLKLEQNTGQFESRV